MRIPLYICLPLAISLFGGLLWFGAHDTDFTTEPSDAEITSQLSEWKAKHPTLPPRQFTTAVAPRIENSQKPAPTKEYPTIPDGELTISPGLDHYSELNDLPTESYQKLAIELETKAKLQHSLLAWERSIDHCDNDHPTKAHKAITQLRQALPIWNTDSEQSFPLAIHIHTPEAHLEAIEKLREPVTQTLLDSSSYIIRPELEISSAEHRPGFPAPPIRIWLSSTGPETKQTPQLTFRFKPEDDVFSLEEQLYLAIYRSISGQFLQISNIQPPAPLSTQDSAKSALGTYLTRRHWKMLSDSLFVENEPPPPAVIIIEEESDQE
ncbi:hypothetical protein [Rubritalea sp.]|uniref:hypothetical protein n=1 Tax=Rubritalea sp. TaxID=2109375 RepID=UPI003EF39AB9